MADVGLDPAELRSHSRDSLRAGSDRRGGGASTGLTYLPELDGLRAVAVAAVTLFHCRPFTYGPFPGGFAGVDVFFVLSAFLISSVLAAEHHRTGSIDVLRFLKRRFMRLMPALALMLAAYLLIAPLAWPGEDHLLNATVAALYMQDMVLPIRGMPAHLVHTWSLSVEEHFYLLWPLPFLWLLRNPRRRLLILMTAWFAATAWRLTFTNETVYFYRFDTHVSGLILGAALFFAPRELFRQWMAWAAIAGFGVVCLFGQQPEASSFISLAEVAAAAVIGCVAAGNAGRIGAVLRHPALTTIGKISYGIYLWQWPIADYLLGKHFGFWAVLAITAPSSIALAALSWSTVERLARRPSIGGYGKLRVKPFTS